MTKATICQVLFPCCLQKIFLIFLMLGGAKIQPPPNPDSTSKLHRFAVNAENVFLLRNGTSSSDKKTVCREKVENLFNAQKCVLISVTFASCHVKGKFLRQKYFFRYFNKNVQKATIGTRAGPEWVIF